MAFWTFVYKRIKRGWKLFQNVHLNMQQSDWEYCFNFVGAGWGFNSTEKLEGDCHCPIGDSDRVCPYHHCHYPCHPRYVRLSVWIDLTNLDTVFFYEWERKKERAEWVKQYRERIWVLRFFKVHNFFIYILNSLCWKLAEKYDIG